MKMLRPRRSEGGIVLIVTVLVLTIVALLGYAFSYGAGINLATARNNRDALRGEAGARSALDWALSMLRADGAQRSLDTLQDAWNSPELQVAVGESQYAVSIVDEDRKLNVNRAAVGPSDPETPDLRPALRRLVRGVDGADGDYDALCAWIDPSRGGVSNAEAPKSPIAVIAALSAIPSLDQELLRGKGDKKSLFDLLCTHPATININTAPKEVLDAIWDDDAVAQAICDQRDEKGFTSAADVQEFLKTLMPPQVAQQYAPLFAGTSTYFSVRVTGMAPGPRRGLVALVKRSGTDVQLISLSPISKENTP